MKTMRQAFRNNSNNPSNPDKNGCTLAVCEGLGVENAVRYLHTVQDCLRAIRSQWSARSCKSMVKGKTIAAIMCQLKSKVGAPYYLVHVEGHVLLLGRDGDALIDTDAAPGIDRRKVLKIYAVRLKKSQLEDVARLSEEMRKKRAAPLKSGV